MIFTALTAGVAIFNRLSSPPWNICQRFCGSPTTTNGAQNFG